MEISRVILSLLNDKRFNNHDEHKQKPQLSGFFFSSAIERLSHQCKSKSKYKYKREFSVKESMDMWYST